MSVMRKFFLLIFVSGILIGLFYVIFFSAFFSITRITIEKNGVALANDVIEPYLNNLRGRNILFVNPDILSAEIEQTFRNEILLTKIRKSYPHHLIIKIEEYPAVLNLRVAQPDKIQKLVLNQIGYAIFENTEIKGLPILNLRSNETFKPKTIAIERPKLDPIITAYAKFTELLGLKIIEGEWKKVGRELHLKTEKNFEVWIDLTADIEKQIQKLKRAVLKLDIYNEPLEYIDLRIASGENEKVIFKRRR